MPPKKALTVFWDGGVGPGVPGIISANAKIAAACAARSAVAGSAAKASAATFAAASTLATGPAAFSNGTGGLADSVGEMAGADSFGSNIPKVLGRDIGVA